MFRDEFWQEAYLKALRGLAERDDLRPGELSAFAEKAADESVKAYDKRFEKGRFRDEG